MSSFSLWLRKHNDLPCFHMHIFHPLYKPTVEVWAVPPHITGGTKLGTPCTGCQSTTWVTHKAQTTIHTRIHTYGQLKVANLQTQCVSGLQETQTPCTRFHIMNISTMHTQHTMTSYMIFLRPGYDLTELCRGKLTGLTNVVTQVCHAHISALSHTVSGSAPQHFFRFYLNATDTAVLYWRQTVWNQAC